MVNPVCPYCGQPARLVTGAWLHPYQPSCHGRLYWTCDPCDAYVGCHLPKSKGGKGSGTLPLGSLANAQLRALRIQVHELFDPLWKQRIIGNRHAAYRWLVKVMEVDYNQCHIGMFNDDQCRKAIQLLRRFHEELSNTRG